MSLSAVLAQVDTLISSVTDVTNVYQRKVTPRNEKEFDDLFGDYSNDRFMGFEIYCTDQSIELTAFNKKRNTFIIRIDCFIGVKEGGATKSYNTLKTILENIKDLLGNNLTCNGTCANSEFPEASEIIAVETTPGLAWSAFITWEVYVDEIFTSSIS